jgi:hypothetical protein
MVTKVQSALAQTLSSWANNHRIRNVVAGGGSAGLQSREIDWHRKWPVKPCPSPALADIYFAVVNHCGLRLLGHPAQIKLMNRAIPIRAQKTPAAMLRKANSSARSPK